MVFFQEIKFITRWKSYEPADRSWISGIQALRQNYKWNWIKPCLNYHLWNQRRKPSNCINLEHTPMNKWRDFESHIFLLFVKLHFYFIFLSFIYLFFYLIKFISLEENTHACFVYYVEGGKCIKYRHRPWILGTSLK